MTSFPVGTQPLSSCTQVPFVTQSVRGSSSRALCPPLASGSMCASRDIIVDPFPSPHLHSALLGHRDSSDSELNSAPSDWQSLLSHFSNFRHLWPLKDLKLTSNQVRKQPLPGPRMESLSPGSGRRGWGRRCQASCAVLTPLVAWLKHRLCLSPGCGTIPEL